MSWEGQTRDVIKPRLEPDFEKVAGPVLLHLRQVVCNQRREHVAVLSIIWNIVDKILRMLPL